MNKYDSVCCIEYSFYGSQDPHIRACSVFCVIFANNCQWKCFGFGTMLKSLLSVLCYSQYTATWKFRFHGVSDCIWSKSRHSNTNITNTKWRSIQTRTNLIKLNVNIWHNFFVWFRTFFWWFSKSNQRQTRNKPEKFICAVFLYQQKMFLCWGFWNVQLIKWFVCRNTCFVKPVLHVEMLCFQSFIKMVLASFVFAVSIKIFVYTLWPVVLFDRIVRKWMKCCGSFDRPKCVTILFHRKGDCLRLARAIFQAKFYEYLEFEKKNPNLVVSS